MIFRVIAANISTEKIICCFFFPINNEGTDMHLQLEVIVLAGI